MTHTQDNFQLIIETCLMPLPVIKAHISQLEIGLSGLIYLQSINLKMREFIKLFEIPLSIESDFHVIKINTG